MSESKTTKTKTMRLKRDFDQAELQAKRRSEINLSVVNEQEAKANEKGFMLVRQKETNRTSFSQNISENIDYLNEKKYLTGAENSFVFKLAPYLQSNTNALTDRKTGQFFSVTDIAKKLGISRTNASLTIDALLQKGILFEFVNVVELKIYGRTVTQRPFFMNPEIICCGDKSRLDAGIVDLMVHYNILERKGIKLPIKAIRLPNARYGKLVSRKSYLEMRKATK
ncbi:hypothetical protein D3C75_259040 [compost metagenome]